MAGKKKIDFDVVREIAMELPDVEVGAGRGGPGLKVGGKLLACPAIHRSAEPDSLMVRIDFERRTELIAAAPNVYYVTDHYVNYPSVLVRLSEIDREALRGLLRMSWRFVTSNTKTEGRRVPKQ